MPSAIEFFDSDILIVDDQAANVQLLELMLRDAGYRHITVTQDPHRVCELHRIHGYDLILLDLHMPGMDGFQVMEGLKEIEADGYIPVLVITADPGHKLHALAAGARDFVSKPFDLVEVKTRIHNMLEVRLLYKQLETYSRALESMALHDSLTGLPNRRLLMERLALTIAHASRNRHAMAVLFLDLDGFKQVNDTLGHDAGDALLGLVADRLMTTVRQEDTVARLGGDEFVVGVWELTHAGQADTVASKLIQAVSQPYLIHGQSVNITISAGVSLYPAHGEDGETLIKSADRALYAAKRSGKNTFCIASDMTERFKPGHGFSSGLRE